MGAVVSAIGILVSFYRDLPTGATIVCTFGVVLMVLAVLRVFVRRPHHASVEV
jgi:zinc/manganese transport system permease protein